MAELIDKGVIYNKVAELEELARNRVLDTSSNSPCYMRYVSQLNERTTLKHLIADTEATTEAEIRNKVIDEAIKAVSEAICGWCCDYEEEEGKCSFNGYCDTEKPMREKVVKALEKLKEESLL